MEEKNNWNFNFSPEDWEASLRVLRALSKAPNDAPDVDLMKGLVSKIYKTARKDRRKETESQRQAEDIAAKKQSYMFHYQMGNVEDFLLNETVPDLSLHKSSGCYACGERFHQVHLIYHRLCPDCAALHIEQRERRGNLEGRVAIVTGGRIKVGFATALRFLRDGAKVIVTTRFPNDALFAFSQEKDFDEWEKRLFLYGLDLRNIKSIENFIQYIFDTNETLDILVNNAAQTIKYPTTYYQQLAEREQKSIALLSGFQEKIACKSEILEEKQFVSLLNEAEDEFFPKEKTDIFNQPLDLRTGNSWTATLNEIDTFELIEVNLINNIAPFILNSRLKPLFQKSNFEKRFIINVTSSEGQFSYPAKTIFHPHTNMTKAAMNMMTRTSADDFARFGIYMNSVDVGWVSTGNPLEKKVRLAEEGHVMPLDIFDAASRIYAPILDVLTDNITWGKLFKNYKIVDW